MTTNIRALVPISGGKDSQAALKLAVGHFGAASVRGLFCDTQWEHPDTYLHVERIGRLYGVPIVCVTGGSVEEQVLKHRQFPVGGARFCTKNLKIRETKLYCRSLAAEQGPFEVWYGMRLDESPARRTRYAGKVGTDLYEPHEVLRNYPKYLGRAGVRFRLPILAWSRKDVLDFLAGEEHPHYAAGFDRVGCFPCLAAGDRAKRHAFAYDDFGRGQQAKVVWLEQQTGKSVWTASGPGCAVCAI